MGNLSNGLKVGILFASVAASLGTRADPVLDWTALALDCIRADSTAPTLSSRDLAILHTAIYDAVNSITRTHQAYRFQLDAPAGASAEAAAVGAAFEVMVTLYPSYEVWAQDLYGGYVASAMPGDGLTNGLALGRLVGGLVIGSRAEDGSSTDIPYIPSSAPGQWQRTPPLFRPPVTPQWRYVDTFCLPEIEPFMPDPPPALGSSDYVAALIEVQAVGGKTNTLRTPEQSQIATFWSDFSYTEMPPGHWHDIAAGIARAQGNGLEDNARMFALLSLAQADGAIVCWEAKYRYNLWRPYTAIQRANEDGNPATLQDTNWSSYLAAPPFPSYTSGRGSFSKASAQVLTHFYGTDAITFNAGSDSLPGVARTFQSLAACADEIGQSRIYGGIHFQFDNVAGKACGKKIGDYIAANFLLPNNQLPFVRLEGFSNSVPQVRMHGHIGAVCVLQCSTDLRVWQSACTNTAVPGGTAVNDAGAAAPGPRFYRAIELR